ncbi:hypothetical protein GQ55_8G129400 [Panicum hallii var. hallii]|uniref:Uncharacterized protein n=1 Tax=Panicum hallii var. hallii TaxID=1504633 RepID=A0A2T7CMZ2_9POAL|nr:hypothetical protein GQ55_8G129400 [Panicum hallii var. hallii]
MGLAVARRLHQNALSSGAGVGHYRRSAVGGEGAQVAASSSGGSAGSGAVVAAASSTASEASGRRPGATAPAASRMAHWSPEKLGELLTQETTQMASTKVARKRRTNIKGNQQIASHLTLQIGDVFTSLSLAQCLELLITC